MLPDLRKCKTQYQKPVELFSIQQGTFGAMTVAKAHLFVNASRYCGCRAACLKCNAYKDEIMDQILPNLNRRWIDNIIKHIEILASFIRGGGHETRYNTIDSEENFVEECYRHRLRSCS